MKINRIIYLMNAKIYLVVTDFTSFYITNNANELASQHKIQIEL